MDKLFYIFGLIFLLGLTSCTSTKEVAQLENTTKEIKELSGKWKLNNSSDYLIFEDTTQKMVLKSSCGILTSDYIQINQAIIFNHLKQFNPTCEFSQNLIENLQKTAYFKVNSSNQIIFYDEKHHERLTLIK